MENKHNSGKDAAIVCYFTIIGTVIAIFMNNDNKSYFASFHIRQALGIFLSFFMLGYFISYFNSWWISGAFYLFYFLLWIYGFLGALQGETKEIPLLGKLSQSIFKTL